MTSPVQNNTPNNQVTGIPEDSISKEDQTISEVSKESLERPIQKKKHRCWKCNKRVGLLPVDCRCGYIFCTAHGSIAAHGCDFDYREEQVEKLKKQNQVIIADKLGDRI